MCLLTTYAIQSAILSQNTANLPTFLDLGDIAALPSKSKKKSQFSPQILSISILRLLSAFNYETH